MSEKRRSSLTNVEIYRYSFNIFFVHWHRPQQSSISQALLKIYNRKNTSETGEVSAFPLTSPVNVWIKSGACFLSAGKLEYKIKKKSSGLFSGGFHVWLCENKDSSLSQLNSWNATNIINPYPAVWEYPTVEFYLYLCFIIFDTKVRQLSGGLCFFSWTDVGIMINGHVVK